MHVFQNINRFILVALLLFAISLHSFAAGEHDGNEDKSFNLKEMIFSHITDAYDWHLFSVGEKHYSIPLPVIVKSKNTGEWHVFMSSKLAHGHSYEGFHVSTSEKNIRKIVEINAAGEEVRPLDLSFTKNAASIMLSCIILIVVFFSMAAGYKKDPLKSRRGLIGSLEMLTISIQDGVIKPCVGPDYKRFTPYLLTAFFFIFINNLMGLIPFFPGGANVTGNISVTFVLAMFTFFITNVFGNKEYWKEVFWPDVPTWLKVPLPIMPLVEILGMLTKPFALMIRLFANMLSGHMIILVLMGLIFMFANLLGAGVATGVSVLSITFSIFMLALDVLISFIQAYVFTMLSAIFIGLARQEHHHAAP